MADELPPLLQAVERFRQAVLRQERAAAVRLVRAYGSAYQRLQGDIEALSAVISELQSPTWGQVERLSLYRSLQAQIADEIGRYAVIAENEIGLGAETALAAGLRYSERLVQLSLPGLEPAQLRALWVRLNPDAVLTMAGFLEQNSPLFINLRRLGDDVAALVADKLREGIILGFSPRKVARIIRDASGQGLTWSLNTARTANVWAYRIASHANYRANSHVVTGWTWYAQIGDPRTCLSCVNMHGSEHPLSEVLNDHHSGRCAPIPKTVSYRNLGLDVPDDRVSVPRGEDWFRGLSAGQQRDMMGMGMWEAWKKGQFEFSELSVAYQNDVYGEMLREASLKGMLGVAKT